jgi:putative transposase
VRRLGRLLGSVARTSESEVRLVATMIDICQVKYLNNIVEQDHRFIKKITKPMMGFKAFHSAQATIAGIETAHMIRKGQLSEENIRYPI